jgi:hypothetical protein
VTIFAPRRIYFHRKGPQDQPRGGWADLTLYLDATDKTVALLIRGILPENFGRPPSTLRHPPGRVPNGSLQTVKVNLPANLLRASSVRRRSFARVCNGNRTWFIKLSNQQHDIINVHRLQTFPFIAELIHILAVHYDVKPRCVQHTSRTLSALLKLQSDTQQTTKSHLQ